MKRTLMATVLVIAGCGSTADSVLAPGTVVAIRQPGKDLTPVQMPMTRRDGQVDIVSWAVDSGTEGTVMDDAPGPADRIVRVRIDHGEDKGKIARVPRRFLIPSRTGA